MPSPTSLTHSILRGLLASCILFSVVSLARAQTYAVTSIGSFGGASTIAYGINNAGTVVGGATDENGHEHAFSFSHGTLTDLGTLGGTGSEANAISNTGLIAGYAQDGSGRGFAVIFSGGTVTSLGVGSVDDGLGGNSSQAYGVNNAGLAVGYATDTDGNSHAVAFSGGSVIKLPDFGGFASLALGINNTGTIVGYGFGPAPGNAIEGFSTTGGGLTSLGTLPGDTSSVGRAINDAGTVVGYSGTHAFAYSNGTMGDLGALLAGASGIANAINSSGAVVGKATYFGSDIAFLYRNGAMVSLDSLVTPFGVGFTNAYGINDSGQIIAEGDNGFAYLLTPIPEPATYAALAGLAALGSVAWKRRASRTA